MGRRLHRRLAQDLAARVVKSTYNPAGGHSRSLLGHRIVSRPRWPRRLKGAASSAGGLESSERRAAEMSSVQALMELALPRFAMTEGPRRVHPPWSVETPAPSQIEPRGGEDSRCSMHQSSFSSVYLNLDALASSSSEESLDVKKYEDLVVTVVCKSEGIVTRVNSKEVLSDEDLPSVFGPRDIRQVIRRRDRPPDGPTRRTAQSDCRQEPSAPAVDLVTGKCNPGKVSRTVSTSPLTLDMTVMCIPEPEILQPMAATQGAVPPDTVNKTVAAFDTSTPAVATPATVVGKPDPQAKDFPTLLLSESSDLLPSFGLSSSSSSPMLPWGTAEDSSPSFSPNRVREGLSQNGSGEGSLFNVSPLSPGLVVRPTREGGAAPPEGVLLPTLLGDFDDSVLGDPINYERIEQLPGSESPLSLPVCTWPPNSALFMDVIQTVLAPRKSEWLEVGTSVADPPVMPGNDGVLKSGLPGCPYRFLESGELPFTDGNPAYGLQLHHPRFLELVGAPESARLLDCSPSFWVEELGKEQAMAAAVNLQWDAGVMLSNLQILSQFAMAMNRMSFSMMALGLGRSLFPREEVDALAPAPRAVRASSYMSAMGLWHLQNNPNIPGPVPASSCHSCMSCKYCFPEGRRPPE